LNESFLHRNRPTTPLSILNGYLDQLAACPDAGLIEELLYPGFDGCFRNLQSTTNFLVRQAIENAAQNVRLSLAERAPTLNRLGFSVATGFSERNNPVWSHMPPIATMRKASAS
jgi:hypothetical protein